MENVIYIDVKDVAKLVRRAPNQKFSVKCDRFSLGAAIDVKWTDGPSTEQVQSIISLFEGSRYDGMTDTTTYVNHVMGGETVRFGAKFVQPSRIISNAAKQEARARVTKMAASEVTKLCRGYSVQRGDAFIHYMAHNMSFYNDPQGSPLVIELLLANSFLQEEREKQ